MTNSTHDHLLDEAIRCVTAIESSACPGAKKVALRLRGIRHLVLYLGHSSRFPNGAIKDLALRLFPDLPGDGSGEAAPEVVAGVQPDGAPEDEMGLDETTLAGSLG